MSDDEFFKAVGDVKPIASPPRVALQKQAADAASLKTRRLSAQQHSVLVDPLVDAEASLLDPYEVLSFQRPGVQHGVFKQLRLGRYTIDARLDLHRLTLEQARRAVWQFVRDCLSHDIRCALITHGKGVGRKTPALIKSHLAHWLPQISEILAFHSAQPQHGGLGACYIMLKKSERKRQENIERHQRRQ